MSIKKLCIYFICFCTILIVILICFMKNKNVTFMKDDVLFAVLVNGESSTSFPPRGKYYVDVNCINADGKWLAETWEMSIENITGNVVCNVSFTSIDSSSPRSTMVNYIKNSVGISGNGEIVNYSNASYPDNDSVGTPANYKYSGCKRLSETYNCNLFVNFGDGYFNFYDDNMSGGYSYYLYIDFLEAGYYSLCYDDAVRFGFNTTSVVSGYAYTASEAGCVPIGFYDTGETMYFKADLSSDVNFSIKKLSSLSTNGGYRYIGRNPNNYVWFNNELWRIIGVLPTCLTANCGDNGTELVKIIRNDSIGNFYDDYSATDKTWGHNNLYKLLNLYYFNSLNANETTYCYRSYYSSDSSFKVNGGMCDYFAKGIHKTDSNYYENMVANVYWNTGVISTLVSGLNTTTAGLLPLERNNQTIQGNVGLMNYSDFAFGSRIGMADLIGLPDKINPKTNRTDSLVVSNWTSLNNMFAWTVNGKYKFVNSDDLFDNFAHANPAVYLDSSVYIVSGDGSYRKPYQLAM